MNRISLALLPGTLCTANLWQDQIEALGDIAKIQIIETWRHGDLTELAEHVHAVMPPRFAVAGLSFGGIVALAVWQYNPAAISHLALMNTTAAPVTAKKRADQLAQVETARSGQFQRIASAQAEEILSLVNRGDDETYRRRILKMAETVGIEGFANQIHAQINRVDSRPLLSQVTCPTLVLCGEQDAFCPPSLHQEMAAKIPNSILQILPDCGHLSSLEQPERVTQAMRKWLQQW